MGTTQSEAPYYQPNPGAPDPFGSAPGFPDDPDFSSCQVSAEVWDERCRYAWALLIVDSTDVVIRSAGLYSFFNEYFQDCIDTNDCQSEILFVTGSYDVVIYNLFTVATVNIASGIDETSIDQSDNQRGFTTEVSVWLPLPGLDNVKVIYVGTEVFDDPTLSCDAPCLLVFPTSELETSRVITPSDYTTSLEYGTLTSSSANGALTTVFVTSTTTLTFSFPGITVDGMPFSNVNITSESETSITMNPSVDVDPTTIELPAGDSSSTERVIYFPPWPLINQGPEGSNTVTDPNTESSTSTGLDRSTTYWTGIRTTITAPGATVTTVTFPGSTVPTTISCPARTQVAFNTPRITVRTTCTDTGTTEFEFRCPTTKVVSFLDSTTAVIQHDCSFVTSWSTGQFSSSTNDPIPVWTTWPRYGSIEHVTTSVTEPVQTDDGVIVPCTAWFFFFCIDRDDIEVGGWNWILPPGTYPPGPPPTNLISPPPGIQLTGPLPPWPRITIGRDRQITTPDEPECETRTASGCSTTSFVSETISDGTTITTDITSNVFCETIVGCSVSDSEETTSSTDSEVGTQTIAPVGTWVDDEWPTTDPGAAYSSSVFADLRRRLAARDASNEGSVVTFASGPTASPTCASSSECGGRVCSGYWCDPSPTGPPPGFKDPRDPNSDGYTATTTSVGEPDPTTSDEPEPSPSPSQEVRIYFRQQESRSPGDAPAFGVNWVWLERPVDSEGFDICSAEEVYVQTENNRPVNNPGWPVNMEADDEVWGRDGCRYIENEQGPGQFECDGVNRFPCTKHPQFDDTLECNTPPLTYDTWFPRVVCTIPASNSRSARLQWPPSVDDEGPDNNGTGLLEERRVGYRPVLLDESVAESF